MFLKIRAAQRNDGPQKREVSFSTEFVRKSEIQVITDRIRHVEEQMGMIHRELKEDRAALMIADEQRSAKIHDRMNELSSDFNDKFQSLPNEVIVILKNTGALK